MKTQKEIISFLNDVTATLDQYTWSLKKFPYQNRVFVFIERCDDEKFISYLITNQLFRKGFTLVEAGVNQYNAPKLTFEYKYNKEV